MSNKNARLQFENLVTPFAMAAITDSGDQTIFTTQASLFSEQEGYAPDIRPDGILTGGNPIPAASGANNAVDCSALTCYLAGVLTAVGPTVDETITRPVTNVAKINSLTVNSGGAFTMVSGTDGATSTFSATRGGLGGPPFIPVGSIEVCQIWVTTSAAAPITSDQIKQVPNTHRELSALPDFSKNNFEATITFDSALPAIHTGGLSKGVYASYAEPIFSDLKFANDFVPSETSYSPNTTETYDGPIASFSSSANQASFTAVLTNGITDAILEKRGKNIFIRFYQDRYKSPYVLDQGILGISRSFGSADNPTVSCTLSPATESQNRAI